MAPRESWSVHVTSAFRAPAASGLAVALAPGPYTMIPIGDVHYEIQRTGAALKLTVRQVSGLRNSGGLVIDGLWP